MKESKIEELLEENIKLTQENNRLLRKIRRSELMQTWSTILFYAMVIGIPVLLYRYYFEDYYNTLQRVYEQIKSGINDPTGLPAQAFSENLRKELEKSTTSLFE